MPDQYSESPLPRLSPSIYLDYGADEHDCTNQGFEICERGMRFNARWQFSLGTQLAISFSYHDGAGKIHRVPTEGIVVDCAMVACKCYVTTLLFLELPEQLRAVLPGGNQGLQVNVSGENKPRSIQPKASLN